MVSSLAAQLAGGASLNASQLADRSKRKFPESYLFSGHDADSHDTEALYALGLNGLAALKSLDPAFSAYEDLLFSEVYKNTERTLLSEDQNNELRSALESLLPMLGPHLLEASSAKVLEWLVRKFRINDFDVQIVLNLFLPYHEAPQFVKMLSILHIKESSPWHFLLPFKSSVKSPPRSVIVKEMVKNSDIARSIVSLLSTAVATLTVHRAFLAFYTATLVEFIRRTSSFDAETLTFLIPAVLDTLKTTMTPCKRDSMLGSYIILSVLSQKCSFTPEALEEIMRAMVRSNKRVDAMQLMTGSMSILGPQADLPAFSKDIVDGFLRMKELHDAVRTSMTWSGTEKVLKPMLEGLITHINDDRRMSLLELIISLPHISQDLILKLVELLFKSVVSEDDDISNQKRRMQLLSMLYQRYQEIVKGYVDGILSNGELDREVVEKLLISMAIPISSANENNTSRLILGSSDKDANVRAVSVKEIMKHLGKSPNNLDHGENSALQSSIQARLLDTDAAVLESIYAKPEVLLPFVSSSQFLTTFAGDLTKQDLTRSALRLHVGFFCHAFCDANPKLTLDVLLELVFGYLLFTKPRQKKASTVWMILLESASLGRHPLLAGLRELPDFANTQDFATFTVDEMAKINLSIASRLADNILSLNSHPVVLEKILAKMNDTNTSSNLLSHLIIFFLLKRLPAEGQIDTALKILDLVHFHHNPLNWSAIVSGIDEDLTVELESDLSRSVVLKPNSPTTAQKLQARLLIALPTISAITDTPGSQDKSKFLQLMRSLYTLANASTLDVHLGMHITKSIFTNIGSGSLMFLASIWSQPGTATDVDNDSLCYVALRHATAFLRAQPSDSPMDFQCILPFFLCTLLSKDRRVRAAVLDCIAILRKLSLAEKPSTVYAYDLVYGPSSASLQYLDWVDVQKYTQLLHEHREHLLNDFEYLVALHQDSLSPKKADGKKESKYRHRVLCYLLSHIISCPIVQNQIALLKIAQYVSDKDKLQMLRPMIELLLKKAESTTIDVELARLTLAIESYDRTVAKALNASDSEGWTTFLNVLRFAHNSVRGRKLWSSLGRQLHNGLFHALSNKRQLELSISLLKLGISDDVSASNIKSLLRDLIQQQDIILALITTLRPSSNDTPQRASKRARVDSSAADDHEDNLSLLVLLMEILNSQKLAGSAELISCLLETLNRLMSGDTGPQSELSYLEQLLMSLIEKAAVQIQDPSSVGSNSLRVDILVDRMRAADNPQTFHQALLLLASLARLAPESVLRNVMPIFTFMGSNIFHRDDLYSFKVIQKTIQSIVPAMIVSLKQKHNSLFDIRIGARDFLTVFTDASTHIPRHRRTNFFTQLVDVLGTSDFLAPICMLLVDKTSNRVIRQSPEESGALLSLPLALLQHHPMDVRTQCLREMIGEVRGICGALDNPQDMQTSDTTFLQTNFDEDSSVTLPLLRKRQSYALLLFVGHALRQFASAPRLKKVDIELPSLVSVLLETASMQKGVAASIEQREITVAAQWSLTESLKVISTAHFSAAVLSMLKSDQLKVQEAALVLLADRLPAMTAESREEVSPSILEILDCIKSILLSSIDTELAKVAIQSITSIATSACTKEEARLVNMIPLVLDCIQRSLDVPQAMTALRTLIHTLGPRVIGHLNAIVNTCSAALQEAMVDTDTLDESVAVLNTLLKTVPAFLGHSELKSIVTLCLMSDALSGHTSQMDILDSLMTTMARRIPSQTLLQVLCETTPSIIGEGSMTTIGPTIRLFSLFKRTLQASSRADVFGSIRAVFNQFIQAFDLRSRITGDVILLEDKVIAAFLEVVLKLNESAFQPLFRRLYDWAFGDLGSAERKITFCRLYSALIILFKSLLTPYMSLVWKALVGLLESYNTGKVSNKDLWICTVDLLHESFIHDEGVFWRDDKLRQMAKPLADQIVICVKAKILPGKILLSSCLSGFVDCTDDDALLKSINLNILMHTRSEDSRIRLFALSCSVALWQNHAQKLVGFVSETSTFILECGEDDNDEVVKEARRLKKAVEAEAGVIDGL